MFSFLFFLNIVIAADSTCLPGLEIDNRQTLANECYAGMCRDEVNIPQTRDELAQMRQQYGIPQFKPQNHSGLKRGNALLQRFRTLNAQQLVDVAIDGSVAQLTELRDLMGMVAMETSDSAVFLSSVNLSPEEKAALVPSIKNFFSNMGKGRLLLDYLEQNSFSGQSVFQAGGEDFASSIREFYEIELPTSATAPTPQELAVLRSAFTNGWSSMTNGRRKEIRRILRDMMVLPLRGERQRVTSLVQESLRIGMERIESEIQGAEFTCNLSDFYRRRAAQMQSSGVLKDWEKQARTGMHSQIINLLSGSERAAVESTLNSCKVKLQIPNAESHESVTGLVKEVREVQALIGSCELQVQPTDNVSLNFGQLELNVSGSTLAYGGSNVFFHEMGHCLSQALIGAGVLESSPRIAGLLSCMRSMHGGSGRYLEEDFADWISVRIAPDAMNIGCYLSGVLKPSTVSYEPHPQDNHSSPLFRALHGAVLRGEELPPSCSSLISQSERRPIACGL